MHRPVLAVPHTLNHSFFVLQIFKQTPVVVGLFSFPPSVYHTPTPVFTKAIMSQGSPQLVLEQNIRDLYDTPYDSLPAWDLLTYLSSPQEDRQ